MKAIACVDINGGMGYQNRLPWKLSCDLKRFRNLTTEAGENTLIVGRKTAMTLPHMAGRQIVVLSSLAGESLVTHSAMDAISRRPDFRGFGTREKIFEHFRLSSPGWIIGGAGTYRAMLPIIHEFWITRIYHDFVCDTYMPRCLHNFQYDSTSYRGKCKKTGLVYQYEKWVRTAPERVWADGDTV